MKDWEHLIECYIAIGWGGKAEKLIQERLDLAETEVGIATVTTSVPKLWVLLVRNTSSLSH